MRKVIFAIIICVAILGACGSTIETEPAPTVTVTQPAAPAAQPAPDAYDMVDAMRAAYPEFWTVEDYVIIDTAQMVCETLRGGATALEVGTVAESYLGTDAAAVLVAGAVVYLCPDQNGKIRS